MRNFLSTANWPFAVKFAVPCLMALVLVLVVEFVAIGALDTIKVSFHDVVEQKYNASLFLEQSVDRLRAANGELYLAQVKQAAGLPQNISQETGKIASDLDQIAATLVTFKTDYASPADIEKIDQVLQNVKTYRKAVTFVGSMLDIDFKATVNFVLPLRGAYEDMISNLSSISNRFLESSREDSYTASELARVRTRFIYIFSVVILILTTLIMFPVIYSTARSITNLALATERLADGDTKLDLESLVRKDELGRLVKALTVFRDNIERVTALKKVSLLYASMNAMLDSLKQGLCSFGPDGICSDTFSKACLTLLEGPPVGHHISDVLRLPADKKSSITNLLKLLFAEKKTIAASSEEILGMFPTHFYHSKDLSSNVEDLSISLEYRPILNSVGKIQSVLVVATDHSKELAARRMSEEREREVIRALRILSYRNQFIQFFRDITAAFASPEVSFAKISYEQVKRDIHTYKGVASVYYFQGIVDALHNIESVLETTADMQLVRPSLISATPSVRAAIADARQEVVKILGDDFDKQGLVRTIPLSLLKRFAGEMRATQNLQDAYENYVHLLIGEPIHKLLSRIDTEIGELADRYGKNVAPCRFEGENFQVMTEAYDALFTTFTHISRNIIAHAVDDPTTRKALGKAPECTITLGSFSFKRDNKEWFRLSFSDDGAGIDVKRLREKLLSRYDVEKIKRASDDEIMQYIFEGNLSTAPDVGELSGRGVGMNAVKYEAERLGGHVRVESEIHRFTRITIEVPAIWNDEDRRLA